MQRSPSAFSLCDASSESLVVLPVNCSLPTAPSGSDVGVRCRNPARGGVPWPPGFRHLPSDGMEPTFHYTVLPTRG